MTDKYLKYNYLYAKFRTTLKNIQKKHTIVTIRRFLFVVIHRLPLLFLQLPMICNEFYKQSLYPKTFI